MRSTKFPRLVAASLVVAISTIMGCSDTSELPNAPDEVEVLSSSHVDAGVPVVTLDAFEPVGTSQLVRTPNGVNYSVATSGLSPGHAYTLWIVIFNDPGGCITAWACSPDDIVNADARPDMMYAAGHLVGGSGTATFSGRRAAWDLGGSANEPVALPAYGLEDPSGAEIWFAVHDHGPVDPAYLPDMIQSIDGGCTDSGVPVAGAPSPWNDNAPAEPERGSAFGRRGSNTCQTVQIAIHLTP